MKKPFSRMRVVKYKDLFSEACSKLGTHHSFKVSVHPLKSGFHKYTYRSVSAGTRTPFPTVICRPEAGKYQMSVFPSRTKNRSAFTKLYWACKAFSFCLTAISRQELKNHGAKRFSVLPPPAIQAKQQAALIGS